MNQRRSSRACLALLAAALLSTGATAAPEASGPQLLPDTGGAIRSVVLAVNSARRAALRNAELVSNIVNGLPPAVDVRIIANDPDAFIVARNPWPERIRFIDLPPADPITIWTQDPFLVLRDAAGAISLLTSREFERAGDSVFAERLGEVAGYPVRRSELYFEGGNIVSDTEHIFIGANTIAYNTVQLDRPETQVVKMFQQALGRPVLVVGPLPQPIAHIDMALTPLGNGRVALADAAWGARIAEQALAEAPETVQAFEEFCQAHFFGHPAIERLQMAGGQAIAPPDLAGKTREMMALSHQVAPLLNGIAGALSSRGYRVERVPFLYGGPESLAGPAGEGGSVAAYPMLTYNNVLIETAASGDRAVYLPRYGWPAMDEAAAAAWRALGFEPRPIDGLTISAMYGGALRCSVKVLRR